MPSLHTHYICVRMVFKLNTALVLAVVCHQLCFGSEPASDLPPSCLLLRPSHVWWDYVSAQLLCKKDPNKSRHAPFFFSFFLNQIFQPLVQEPASLQRLSQNKMFLLTTEAAFMWSVRQHQNNLQLSHIFSHSHSHIKGNSVKLSYHVSRSKCCISPSKRFPFFRF